VTPRSDSRAHTSPISGAFPRIVLAPRVLLPRRAREGFAAPADLEGALSMWRRLVGGVAVLAAVVTMAPADAQAQDHSISINFGYFTPRGEDARVDGDVLNANRCFGVRDVCEPLLFEVSDFNNATISGEWLIGLGDFFEVGAGIGYYQRTVPSIYENLQDIDGTEIEQDLKLRIVPLTATVRFIPTSRLASIQPYIGVGVGLLNWRYSETGEFVDTRDYTIFRTSYLADGNTLGLLLLGGVKAPIGRTFLLGGEIRYQQGEGDLPNDFVGEKIDLGGFTYQAVLQFRF
jgi:hypothetical protein